MISPILSVQDVDASVKFYTEKLGFKLDFIMAGADGVNAFAFVNLGKAINIGLTLDRDLTERGKGIDMMLNVSDETDLDAMYTEIKGRGVVIESDIADQYWGDRTFALFDPDNYRLTFAKTTQNIPMEDIEAIMRGEKSPT